ncbi:MAG: peptide chain release factor N(5)-glutamine methyltransferase [Gammaproteobacteria bacterium]|nr:MAG: peptide chain release factor N(5)-glutamine methyltransferase [Gammaproteobacteria bacterium]
MSDFLQSGCEVLAGVTDTPRLDVELLLLKALGKERSYLYTWPEQLLTDEQLVIAKQLLQRRQKGEPVAYIIGRRDFWDFSVEVTSATLIPRPETELLVELALQKYDQEAVLDIADLGTGSGILAIALAREFPDSAVYAVDLSKDAIEVARRNSESLQLKNIAFKCGSWLEPFAGKAFDLIVSNPPYIEDTDDHLEQGDVRFEPRSALVSGGDGLGDIRLIAEQAISHLKFGGVLAVEHGYQQGKAVRDIFVAVGLEKVETEQDLQGHDRVTVGHRSLSDASPE